MATLSQFSKIIKVKAEQIDKNINLAVRKVALVADQSIVVATPVDTSRAKSNWIVSLNAPSASTIEPYFPGSNRSTEAQSTQAAIDQGRSVITARVPGQSIHITNNLDYIGDLNDGKSPQAPPNFVEKSILAAINALRTVRVT